MDIVSILAGSVIFFLFVWVSLVSLIENEARAARTSILLAVLLSMPFFIVGFFEFRYGEVLQIVFVGIFVFSGLVLIVPFNPGKESEVTMPASRIDERDIMFSRQRLKPGSERFDEYYRNHPEYKPLDDNWRKKPGLLNKGSLYYDPFTFLASDANFISVECFHKIVEGEENSEKTESNPQDITNFIKTWAKKQGAIDIGITELKDYHKYTHVGRGPQFGEEVVLDHKYAIAMTVEMDKDMMDMSPYGPAVMESSEQYLKAGQVAVQLAQFIRNLGYPARAHIDGNYRVICPLIARDAGLGEIGRMGLLMTPRLGPRVRISVVTTELPLLIDTKLPDQTMVDFCRICKKCAETCPAKAISFNDRETINGALRWQINSEKCYTLWCISGTDCGRCMRVCPYSHPDNLLHNIIRAGIKNSAIFRKFAMKMDDLIYGKKPEIKEVKNWLKIEPQTLNPEP